MKKSLLLVAAAATLVLAASCGVDKTAGTVGDGNPD